MSDSDDDAPQPSAWDDIIRDITQAAFIDAWTADEPPDEPTSGS